LEGGLITAPLSHRGPPRDAQPRGAQECEALPCTPFASSLRRPTRTRPPHRGGRKRSGRAELPSLPPSLPPSRRIPLVKKTPSLTSALSPRPIGYEDRAVPQIGRTRRRAPPLPACRTPAAPGSSSVLGGAGTEKTTPGESQKAPERPHAAGERARGEARGAVRGGEGRLPGLPGLPHAAGPGHLVQNP